MILLSFDIEEFDMPFEYGGEILFEEQIAISRQGLESILDLLKKDNTKATFFSTVVFAENCKDLIDRLLSEGHELASHTYYHSQFKLEDLRKSKERLEELFYTQILGLRMPRMRQIKAKEVADAGYLYNSSINPTFLPGRYNNLGVSRKYFLEEKLWQIPTSVSRLRIPLFWLSFHNFPIFLYRFLVKSALKKDGYLNVYFHPWEFSEIKNPKYKLPNFTTKNTGKDMIDRFDEFLFWLKKDGNIFGTFKDFLHKENLIASENFSHTKKADGRYFSKFGDI